MTVKTRGDTARARILDAAERLFAERGVRNVSLREIGSAASQRNNSAVQYHFGSREELTRVLYEDRLGPLNVRRRTLLDALTPSQRTDLRALVEVYARPLAEAVRLAGGRSSYARFILRFTLDADTLDHPLDAAYISALRETVDLIADRLTELTPEARAYRLRLMQLTVTAALADTEARLEAQPETRPVPPAPDTFDTFDSFDLEAQTDALISATVGLLTA